MRRSAVQLAHSYLAVAEQSDAADLPGVARRFVLALTRRRLRRLLPKIARSLEQAWNERRGITPIRITTARSLDRATVASFEREGTFVSAAIDPALIGGAVVERGDELVDGSVRTALARLKSALQRKE